MTYLQQSYEDSMRENQRLSAENERLRAELEAVRADRKDLADRRGEFVEEVYRLRAALKRITLLKIDAGVGPARQIAEDVLEGSPDAGTSEPSSGFTVAACPHGKPAVFENGKPLYECRCSSDSAEVSHK